jgi:hypothetical protein
MHPEYARGPARGRPCYIGKRPAEAASASVSNRPPVLKGAVISAYQLGFFAFFDFFVFFVAMMKPSDVGDQLSKHPNFCSGTPADHQFHIAQGPSSRNMIFAKTAYFSKT